MRSLDADDVMGGVAGSVHVMNETNMSSANERAGVTEEAVVLVNGTQSGEQDEKPVWLVTTEAATRARVGLKTIFREVRAGRLKAARVGGRRELRFRPSWVDEWLEARSTPVVMNDGSLMAA